MKRWILIGLLSANLWADPVYKTVDARGNISFSDQPPAPDAEIKSIEVVPVRPSKDKDQKAQQEIKRLQQKAQQMEKERLEREAKQAEIKKMEAEAKLAAEQAKRKADDEEQRVVNEVYWGGYPQPIQPVRPKPPMRPPAQPNPPTIKPGNELPIYRPSR